MNEIDLLHPVSRCLEISVTSCSVLGKALLLTRLLNEKGTEINSNLCALKKSIILTYILIGSLLTDISSKRKGLILCTYLLITTQSVCKSLTLSK